MCVSNKRGSVVTSRIAAKFGAILSVVVLWPCAVSAGAWPQPKDHLLIIVPFTLTGASEEYDAEGKTQRRNRFSKRELSPYAEYGFSKNITFVSTFALTHERTSWLGTKLSQRGLSRVEAGARFAIGKWEDTYYSFQPLLIWHGAMGSSADPVASQRGDIDGEFGLTMGRHFKWLGLDGFSDNLVAIRVRPANRPSELKANLTLGVSLNKDRQVMLKSESYATFSKGAGAAASQIQSNKLGLSFVQRLDKTVTMEVNYSQSLTGRNTIKQTSTGFALWYNF
tara:strand:+ start:6290 stop:7132 length:843 start_codon:yes stop_codon:yes gene_type:complete